MARKSKALITDVSIELLKRLDPNDPRGRTFRQVIHDRLAASAKAGDRKAIQELREWDRVFGPRPGTRRVNDSRKRRGCVD